MATQYIKYAKKCEKKFFFQIIEGAMAFLGPGVAIPMQGKYLTVRFRF